MWQAALCTVALLLVARLVHWMYRWRNPACNGRLPPGSMGFPLLGETTQFFSPSTTSEVQQFVLERVNRYGPIFKTNLVGLPVVASTDPEFNHLVFQEEGRLFQSWYPKTFTEIIGLQSFLNSEGSMYKYLKSLVLKLFGSENLRERLIHEVEAAVCTSLSSWMEQPDVELKEATATMIFNLTAKKLISYDPSETSENLRENFDAFMKGLISYPVNLPGTAYHKCMQGRRKVIRVLKGMLEERQRTAPERQHLDSGPAGAHGDFFDLVVEELGKEKTPMTEAIALDLIFVLLFASFETTSIALTMAVRFLTEHPAVLEELTEEHEAIIRKREEPTSRLTWHEYKSMTFTTQVINETVRLANVVPVIFRKALQDIQINGYTIPAGWAVMVCPPAVHLNPEAYKDPHAFNPWRWKDEKELNAMSKKFMPFGGGIRLCVGRDFSMLQMTVFLHHLVTKYSWKATKGGNIIRTPGLEFPDGFHIQLFPKPLE